MAMRWRTRNESSRLAVEATENGKVLNNCMIRAERQSLGGFHQNMQEHRAESLYEAIEAILRTTVHE